jgi:large subunit ribosomal protein L10
MLTKEQKRQQSEELRGTLGAVNTVFLMENTGLTVNDVNQLRSQVKKSDATYKVVKNSVVKLALEGTELEGLTPYLVGPKALAFTEGDPVALAKVLRDFIKQHPQLSFQRAYLEGKILEAEEAQKIADMPSKEELLTKLVYLLQSPIRRLAVALNAPAQNLASVLGQVAAKQEETSDATVAETAEVTGEATAEEAAEATSEETAEEAAEATSEETAEETAEATSEETAEETAEATSEETSEETAEAKGEETTEETVEAASAETDDETNQDTKES